MRKLYHILALSTAVTLLSSCVNNWLDTTPSTSVPSNTAILNYSDATAALAGMYDGLQGNSTYTHYYAARMFYYGDVRGDDMQARDQGMRTSSCYEMRYTVDDAPNMWNVQYNVIRRANNLLQALRSGLVTDASKEEIGNYEAQALAVRALVHFDLVKVYGMPYTADNGASMGVPIVTSVLDGTATPGRNTVKEVYEQIVTDLTDAINTGYLSQKTTQGYINEWAAKALLCRVYLYMNENQKAFDLAEDIIAHSPYTLWKNNQYAVAWNKENAAHANELIFEIINFNSSDWADREGIAYLYNENGYADAICTKSFVDMVSEDPNDVRLDVILPAQYDEKLMAKYGENKVFINKFPARESDGEMRENNLPVLRLSEVYLNAAEAAAKLNDKPNTVKYLDAIVNRANPDKHIMEAEATLDRVLIERRKELVGEGQRFFDAIRNNEKIVRYNNENNKGWHYSLNKESLEFDRTYFRVLLPIPVSEINANSTLKGQQNPGY